MDVVLGLGIIFIIIGASSVFILQTQPSIVGDLSSLRTARDVVAVLDYTGIFDKGSTAIENNVTALLPENLRMYVTIEEYDENMTYQSTTIIFDDMTENYFGGKWISASGNFFRIIRYKVAFE